MLIRRIAFFLVSLFTLLNKPHFGGGCFWRVNGCQKDIGKLYAYSLPSVSFDLNLVPRLLRWGRERILGTGLVWSLTWDCSVLNLTLPTSYFILNIDFILLSQLPRDAKEKRARLDDSVRPSQVNRHLSSSLNSTKTSTSLAPGVLNSQPASVWQKHKWKYGSRTAERKINA